MWLPKNRLCAETTLMYSTRTNVNAATMLLVWLLLTGYHLLINCCLLTYLNADFSYVRQLALVTAVALLKMPIISVKVAPLSVNLNPAIISDSE